jgi:hypothetical protein
MIRDDLVERKGLKQVERVGLKCVFNDYSSRLSSLFGSIKLYHFKWVSRVVFWRKVTSP